MAKKKKQKLTYDQWLTIINLPKRIRKIILKNSKPK